MEADEGGGENFTDSTALNGSDTNNGTRGFTTGPDLAVRESAPSQNQIDYVFDQEVVDSAMTPRTARQTRSARLRAFKYIDQAGDDHFSIGASVASIPG